MMLRRGFLKLLVVLPFVKKVLPKGWLVETTLTKLPNGWIKTEINYGRPIDLTGFKGPTSFTLGDGTLMNCYHKVTKKGEGADVS